MELSLAPMEGLTGYVVRNAFHHHFLGIDKYYTPFISYTLSFNKKTLRDISPENNNGMLVIPQIMSNRADEVLYMQRLLSEYGYDEININLGCPSGTVSSKKRGAGFLSYPDEMDAFFYELFEKADFPISIKTRIGYDTDELWPKLLSIYKKYPITELTIHPRIRSDFYKGTPRMEAFDLAMAELMDTNIGVCYNGDITSLSDYITLTTRYPNLSKVMIGRGFLANPTLSEQIKNYQIIDANPSECNFSELSTSQTKERFHAFHDDIYNGYLSTFTSETDVMMHMKEIWFYLKNSFYEPERHIKKILKSKTPQEYKIAVKELFRELDLNLMPNA